MPIVSILKRCPTWEKPHHWQCDRRVFLVGRQPFRFAECLYKLYSAVCLCTVLCTVPIIYLAPSHPLLSILSPRRLFKYSFSSEHIPAPRSTLEPATITVSRARIATAIFTPLGGGHNVFGPFNQSLADNFQLLGPSYPLYIYLLRYPGIFFRFHVYIRF